MLQLKQGNIWLQAAADFKESSALKLCQTHTVPFVNTAASECRASFVADIVTILHLQMIPWAPEFNSSLLLWARAGELMAQGMQRELCRQMFVTRKVKEHINECDVL